MAFAALMLLNEDEVGGPDAGPALGVVFLPELVAAVGRLDREPRIALLRQRHERRPVADGDVRRHCHRLRPRFSRSRSILTAHRVTIVTVLRRIEKLRP